MDIPEWLRLVLLVVFIPIGAVLAWSLVSLFILACAKELGFSRGQKVTIVVIVFSLCYLMGRSANEKWFFPALLVGIVFAAKPYWFLLGRLFPKECGEIARELQERKTDSSERQLALQDIESNPRVTGEIAAKPDERESILEIIEIYEKLAKEHRTVQAKTLLKLTASRYLSGFLDETGSIVRVMFAEDGDINIGEVVGLIGWLLFFQAHFRGGDAQRFVHTIRERYGLIYEVCHDELGIEWTQRKLYRARNTALLMMQVVLNRISHDNERVSAVQNGADG